MKIALAHKRLELRGGTERVLYQTAEGLRDRGHEVHLFCQEFRIPPPSGVHAHRLPGVSWPRTARLLTFAFLAPRVIAKHDCDVVMSFDRMIRQDISRSGGGPHKVFLEKMKSKSGPWKALWYRVSAYHRLALLIEKRQLSPAGSWKIIAVCEQTKRETMEAYGVSEERIAVIHNGVDHERFQGRHNHGQTVRRRLGLPSDRSVVLFLGTGFRRKGLGRLLALWERNELPGVHLLVVGNDTKLAQYRRQWNRDPRVIFVGPQTNVEDYYAAADLLVLPSVQEAFGNVVLEALAAGLPVITVPGVGAMDQVEGNLRDGLLANPDDRQELKTKILRMLDPARRSVLSKEARQVAEKYTWRAYLDQVESSLYDCCKQSARIAIPAKTKLVTLSPSR
jgi:UDP-glucose:(heptosyl)LPS alpha-1,3-glucosyltransferase